MPPAMRVFALIVLLLLVPATGRAADIEIKPWRGPDGPISVITIKGELDDGDEARFADILQGARNRGLVILDGPGGSATAGIEIGMAIRQRNFDTLVADEATCASACAIAWLGGADRRMAPGARIGFHSIYDKESGRRSASGNAAVAAYLRDLHLDETAFGYVTSAPPSGMQWLSLRDADNYGIKVSLFAVPKPTGAPADLRRGGTPGVAEKPSAASANPVQDRILRSGASSRLEPS